MTGSPCKSLEAAVVLNFALNDHSFTDLSWFAVVRHSAAFRWFYTASEHMQLWSYSPENERFFCIVRGLATMKFPRARRKEGVP